MAKGFASLDRIQAGKEMLVRIVAMLTKVLMRFDPEPYRAHERAAGLARASPKRGNGLLVVNRWVALGLSFLWPARL